MGEQNLTPGRLNAPSDKAKGYIYDPVTDTWYPIFSDADGYQYTKGMLKDPDTLDWVAAQQGITKNDSLTVTFSGGSVSVTNMIPAVETGLAKDSSISNAQPRKLQDGSGNSITSTLGALDTNIKSQALQVYNDGTDMYVCHAAPGSLLSANVWAIQKISTAVGVQGLWANGAATFVNAATDLPTVKGYSYS